ncbi:hypothetical protein BJX70DRAFT_396071 [Aspergillus crustosus]
MSRSIAKSNVTNEQARADPKRYFGYPEFAKFLSLDTNLQNFRRFERLNVRVILAMQDELALLETSIEQLDNELSEAEGGANNGSFRKDPSIARKGLITQLVEKLEKYNRFMHTYSHHQTVRDADGYIDPDANDGAIDQAEIMFLDKPDLFTPVRPYQIPLRVFLQRSRWFVHWPIWEKEVHESLRLKFAEQHVWTTDDGKIDRFVAGLIVVIGLGILNAGFWVFACVDGMGQRVDVVSVFSSLLVAHVQLTGFLALQTNVQIFRRFDRLNIRALLAMQEELSCLEKSLDELEAGDRSGTNRSKLEASVTARKAFIEQLCAKLEQYNRFIHSLSHIKTLPAANKQDIESVKNSIRNYSIECPSSNHERPIDETGW